MSCGPLRCCELAWGLEPRRLSAVKGACCTAEGRAQRQVEERKEWEWE